MPVRAALIHLARAKTRLDELRLYPTPVRTDGVHVIVWPGLFRLPFLRRFDGYATWRIIFMRRPCRDCDDLLVHELCHVWQMQHHPLRVPLSYVWHGYRQNPYEREARWAAGARPSLRQLPLPADDQRESTPTGPDPRDVDLPRTDHHVEVHG